MTSEGSGWAARTTTPLTARPAIKRSGPILTWFPACWPTGEFLARVVRYLAGEAGIRQFLDIGIPTANNTHEVARAVAPECRVVYVDNDPIVLTHARALQTSRPEGATDYIDADPFGIVAKLVNAVPPGSLLALSHVASDIHADRVAEAGRRLNRLTYQKGTYRTHAQVTRFFDGLDTVEPGVVRLQERRPDSEIEAKRRPHVGRAGPQTLNCFSRVQLLWPGSMGGRPPDRRCVRGARSSRPGRT